jgi:predicted O-linked N-acetylglucosamine transferase (SPINDLY family)
LESPAAPRRNGPITFACLNHPMKMGDACVRAWAEVIRRVPDSRMLIHAQPGEYLRETIAIFQGAGVDPGRVEFIGKVPFADYLKLYRRVDIALDSFPYAGGTTTCDALWMGVPVVTLAGEIAVHRGGVSLLKNVGLPELVAKDIDQYIAIATELASSRKRYPNLRQRLESSIVMNPREFTSDLESALRQIWRDHVLSGS